MTMTTNRQLTNKLRTPAVTGPGGMGCSCCRNYPKARAKVLASRYIRRQTKAALRGGN